MAYVGIDVGGTKVALRGEFSGGVTHESSFRWPNTRDVSDDLSALADHLATARAEWPEPITRVGIAMPATIDDSGHVVTWPSRSHWTALNFGALMDQLFPGVLVRHGDDGELAALAEAASADCLDLAYLGVGTGIGGGLVIGGRLAACSATGACEVGHMIIDRYGEPCVCGRRGCLQAVASGPATLNRAARRRGGEVGMAELRAGLRREESWAVSAVDDSCAAIAVATVNLMELLHPAVVVIGGGFAAAVDDFVHRVVEHAAAWTRPGMGTIDIRPAACGGLSSLQGAVLLARLD
ncbi:ROK family protein [Lentzea tibetensis]|uniref:ROK family protein n=1 Tax=Lentzea tibetensis TaxID=2591470 RepID=A0A563EJB0_9PSEU|nr:ROK family protein [Lentzea tibetensis]TWP46940.1 ROK family protein [Lentzea tibetensis]